MHSIHDAVAIVMLEHARHAAWKTLSRPSLRRYLLHLSQIYLQFVEKCILEFRSRLHNTRNATIFKETKRDLRI